MPRFLEPRPDCYRVRVVVGGGDFEEDRAEVAEGRVVEFDMGELVEMAEDQRRVVEHRRHQHHLAERQRRAAGEDPGAGQPVGDGDGVVGVVGPDVAISGFANEATITVAAMFVLSAGLQRTGALRTLGQWFAQTYVNMSDAGDTYLLRTGAPIVDKSKVWATQLQHSAALGSTIDFTYGADYIKTMPETGSTINGRRENDDNYDEFGAYLQSPVRPVSVIDLVGAIRYDKHSHLNDPVWSPRAGIVFHPSETQSFRVTYNRAFSTPLAARTHTFPRTRARTPSKHATSTPSNLLPVSFVKIRVTVAFSRVRTLATSSRMNSGPKRITSRRSMRDALCATRSTREEAHERARRSFARARHAVAVGPTRCCAPRRGALGAAGRSCRGRRTSVDALVRDRRRIRSGCARSGSRGAVVRAR